ncbi:hypothetical protein N9501_06735 [Amylibacter sp.]|nr:hypothetical protein [Amylibacter sp.]
MNLFILFDHFLVSGSRFLLSILIARALGFENFGTYSLIWTILTLATAMQVPIVITPMMQLGPSISEHRKDAFFATAVFVQFVSSIITLTFVNLVLVLILWERKDVIDIIFAVNAYVLVYNQYEFFRRYFFTTCQLSKALVFDVMLYTVLLLTMYGFLRLGDVTIAAYLFLSCLPAVLICFFILYNYHFAMRAITFHKLQIRRMWKIAHPLINSTISAFISGYAFVYSTAFFLGSENVGGIAAARNVLGPLMVSLMALENSMTREAVLLNKVSYMQLLSYVKKERLKWVIIFFLYVLIVSMFAKPLLEWAYGPEFGQFYILVYWIGLASIPQVISRIQAVKLRTAGNYTAIKTANIRTMFIACVVSPPLVYLFGLNGAGLSFLISTSFVMIFQFLDDPDNINMFWHRG